jgi:hypothetical protein
MRALTVVAACCIAALIPIAVSADGGAITGFAFVDSSVTSMGSQAKLPAGTKIFPPGSKITGSEGCPTTRYNTDGLIVAVLDYTGRPTAASVTITEHRAGGGTFQRAPYYIDLNSGRTLQYLGPIFGNGTYDVRFSYSFEQAKQKTTSATLTLDRTCR